MSTASAPHDAAPKSILVVDDDAPVREVVAWMLEDAGFAVHQVPDAQAALDFLDGHGRVDLVISDINMPGLDGLELTARARRRWPNLPVLLVSGRPPPDGVTPFISKPFRWDALAQAIARSIMPARGAHDRAASPA